MPDWKRVQISFPTTKLANFIEPIKTTFSEISGKGYSTVYGVSNVEGITITGKEASKDISNYIALERNCFAYNPYRINVGSIGMNFKGVKGCVSPAYVVFKTKPGLNPGFLYHYLKSDFGNHLINWYGNRGGVRNALRYDDLCKIDIPNFTIEEQHFFLKRLDRFKENQNAILTECIQQINHLSLLRQSILQEAIEGKLTAEWRKKNPVRKGNPDYDAAALLEKIKTEKQKMIEEGKIRKEKPLSPIKEEEKPFELPRGWVWCRLANAGIFERGKSKHRPRNDPFLFKNGNIPFVQTGEVSQSKNNGFIISKSDRFYNEKGLSQSRLWPSGTLCITIAANIAETGFLALDACFPDSVVGFTSLSGNSTSWFVRHYLSSIQEQIIKFAPATAQKNINLEIIESLLFPLPPLAEQSAIVSRVDRLLAMVSDLEKQVFERKRQAKDLMQAVLREAFEGKKSAA